MEELFRFAHGAVMALGESEFWVGGQFVEGFKLITPKDIALQLIMFALTTIVLGGGYHQFVVKPQQRRLEERQAQQMGPFRRMLVMQIAGVHSRLTNILSDESAFPNNWGKPLLRRLFVGPIAELCANLSATVLTNSDLLQDDERLAVGKYTELLFRLQRQFQHIEANFRALNSADISKLKTIVNDANASIGAIAKAFEEADQTEISSLVWNDEFFATVEANLFFRLARKAATSGMTRPSLANAPVSQTSSGPTIVDKALIAPSDVSLEPA